MADENLRSRRRLYQPFYRCCQLINELGLPLGQLFKDVGILGGKAEELGGVSLVELFLQ